MRRIPADCREPDNNCTYAHLRKHMAGFISHASNSCLHQPPSFFQPSFAQALGSPKWPARPAIQLHGTLHSATDALSRAAAGAKHSRSLQLRLRMEIFAGIYMRPRSSPCLCPKPEPDLAKIGLFHTLSRNAGFPFVGLRRRICQPIASRLFEWEQGSERAERTRRRLWKASGRKGLIRAAFALSAATALCGQGLASGGSGCV